MATVIKCKHCAHFPKGTDKKVRCEKANKLVSGEDIQRSGKSGYKGFVCRYFLYKDL